MYSAELAKAITKAHVAVFKSPIEILQVRNISAESRFSPCCYIPLADPRFYEDPDVRSLINKIPNCAGYVVIFDERVTKVIQDAMFGRHYIKAPVVVWSICIKLIWDKVRILWRQAHPLARVQDEILSAEQIAACLPEGFEFPDNFDNLSQVEAIENIYQQEFDGFCCEMNLKPEIVEQGVLHILAERYVISLIAVRCNGEDEMIRFLSKCSELVLSH